MRPRPRSGTPDDLPLPTPCVRAPSFQNPTVPWPPTAHALRTVIFDRSYANELPDWVADLPAQPTVYATLGLVFSSTRVYGGAFAVFRAILDGLGRAPLNLILSVGPGTDPAEFGSQPPNIHVTQYIPQSLLLPQCDLVITHGGWNTILAALSQGLPLVVIPLGADQPQNAAQCPALGVAKVIDGAALSAAGVRGAVEEVLGQPTYREQAQHIRAEIEALPDPAQAVRLLEQLVAEHAPLLTLGPGIGEARAR